MSRKDSTGAEDFAGGNNGVVMDLQFVSMNPSSQAEKQRNKKVIRSAAMKSFRRKQSSQRTLGKGRPSSQTTTVPLELDQFPPSKDSRQADVQDWSAEWFEGIDGAFSDNSWLSPLSPPSESSSNSSDGEKESSFGEARQGFFGSGTNTQNSLVLSSPVTLLGAGRIDPFRIYPVDSGGQIPELIDHSISVLWPGFSPRGPGRPEPTMPAAWFRKAYERPIAMHALAFGSIVHRDILRSPRLSLDNPIRLFHKVQTMRLLKEELKNPEKAPLDDIILAMLALSTNEVETVANNIKEKAHSPFNSPLASVQWLDVYGSISHVKEHTLAVRSVVARRGGIESVELHGLPELLSLSDILGSTQSLSKPHFPILIKATNLPPIEIDGVPRLPLRKLGKGFEGLRDFGVSERASTVLQNMVDLTIIIDGHCRGAKTIPDMGIFIYRRNALQHSLISLPTGDDLDVGEVSSACLYESIRLAAIIYSVAVTFPLPPLTGIFQKLATALKNIMESSKFDPCWQLCPQTLLWILTLGGIAAARTAERTWYVQNLDAVAGALNLLEWDDVVDNNEEYLWLDSACNSGGSSLWMEVINDRFSQQEAYEF